jgi:hypothetical protein
MVVLYASGYELTAHLAEFINRIDEQIIFVSAPHVSWFGFSR